jgi:hypothetical protein
LILEGLESFCDDILKLAQSLFQRPYQRPMLPTNLLDMVRDPYLEDRQLAAPNEIIAFVDAE